MLPVKTGTRKLSDESKLKLDLFHKRFCEGENRALYGLQHIVYACHASFPLILSPELANLTWLNFNTYTSGGGLQKIEEVVVSDFLLSPLVRPVANRQYEVIPEIRSYFLYLLKDSRWFNLFGIETFGDKRLNELAAFLQQYLQDAKAKRENNASGFMQLNKWAADAWLDPGLLAIEMGNLLKKLVPADSKKNEKEDEWGQLRLNIMAERLGRQIDLNIHSKEADGARLFMNFQKYSRANAARVVDGSRADLFDLYDEVEKEFIEGNVTDEKATKLPLLPGIGQRLLRKKNHVQRVLPLIINIDEKGSFSPRLPESHGINAILNNLKSNADFEITDPVLHLENQKKTRLEISEAIDFVFHYANDEDIVFIYFSTVRKNRFPNNKTSNVKEPETFNDHSIIKARLKEKRNKHCQIVLILDTLEFQNDSWVNHGDIQISLRKIDQSPSFSQINALSFILQVSRFKVTYRELINILGIGTLFNGSVPLIFVADNQWNNYFLTGNPKPAAQTGYPIIYNTQDKIWTAIDEDFNPIPLSLNTYALTFDGKPLEDVLGEVFIRYGILCYNGKVESLDHNQLYLVKPQKDWLSVHLAGMDLFADPGEFARELNDLFEKIPGGMLSKWSGFVLDEQFQEYASQKMEERIKENSLTIRTLKKDDDDAVYYGVTYNTKRKPGDALFNWMVKDITALGESLQKFNRYQYLLDLTRPSSTTGYLEYLPFSVTYICQWMHSDGRVSGEAFSLELLLNEHAMVVENGQVGLKPLELQLESMEDVDVYYSVYLLSSKMAIIRLTKETINKIKPHELVRQSFQLDNALLDLFSADGSAQLKVLFGLTPVIIDFSQTGIK